MSRTVNQRLRPLGQPTLNKTFALSFQCHVALKYYIFFDDWITKCYLVPKSLVCYSVAELVTGWKVTHDNFAFSLPFKNQIFFNIIEFCFSFSLVKSIKRENWKFFSFYLVATILLFLFPRNFFQTPDFFIILEFCFSFSLVKSMKRENGKFISVYLVTTILLFLFPRNFFQTPDFFNILEFCFYFSLVKSMKRQNSFHFT